MSLMCGVSNLSAWSLRTERAVGGRVLQGRRGWCAKVLDLATRGVSSSRRLFVTRKSLVHGYGDRDDARFRFQAAFADGSSDQGGFRPSAGVGASIPDRPQSDDWIVVP
jgi:hypothetical protein